MKNQTGIKLVAAVGIAACMVGSAWGAGTIATVSSYAAPNMVAEINVALQEADVRLDAIEIGGVPDGNSIVTGSVTFIQGGVTTQWDNAASLIDTAAIETGALPSGITVADANVATLFGVAKGGTGLASGTSGGVLAYTATGTLASSALLAQYGIVLGGGAGAVPATLAASANTGAPLLSAGNAANPAYGPLNLAGGATIVTGDLPVSDGGTGAGTAAAAASALGVGTEDSPQFAGIELGHADENTLSASGGVLSIEGAALTKNSDWNLLRAYLADGLLIHGTLVISATADQFKTTTTAVYTIAGVTYTKAATDNLEFSAADTINTAGADIGTAYGIWLIQINAAGTVSTKPGGGLDDQVYDSGAAAIAALPAVDASNVSLGYVLVATPTSTPFVCNTTALTGLDTYSNTQVKALPAAL